MREPLIKRLPILLEERRELHPTILANAADCEKDQQGISSRALRSDLRFLGTAEYALDNDVQSFKRNLREAAAICRRLFERFEAGEAIDKSYVSMLSYKALYDALAAGEFELAKSLAGHMGGRPEIEKQHDHPFDRDMGYALKWFVLGDREQMEQSFDQFARECGKKENKNFRGYAQVFRAILDRDVSAANAGLKELVRGHEREVKRGVFRDTDDELLCVWGVGLANLCRRSGLNVECDSPLIPNNLLIA